MKVSGVFGFGLAPDIIWHRLNEPAFLASVIPGCQKFEESAPQTYDVVSAFGLGPLSIKLSGQVMLDPFSPPQAYHMKASSRNWMGHAGGDATINLTSVPGGTAFRYQANIDIGQGLASVGGQVISGTVDSLSRRFFERLAVKLDTELLDVSDCEFGPFIERP